MKSERPPPALCAHRSAEHGAFQNQAEEQETGVGPGVTIGTSGTWSTRVDPAQADDPSGDRAPPSKFEPRPAFRLALSSHHLDWLSAPQSFPA